MAFGYPGGATPYGMTTAGGVFNQPYQYTDYTEYYVPTPPGRGRRRPVIYVAASLPAGMSLGNMGGFGGGVPTPYGATGGFPMF